jgi:hypothetical protein
MSVDHSAQPDANMPPGGSPWACWWRRVAIPAGIAAAGLTWFIPAVGGPLLVLIAVATFFGGRGAGGSSIVA